MRLRRAGVPLMLLFLAGCAWITPRELERRTDLDQDGSVNQQFGGADCDDGDPGVFPGAPDAWYDGVDADCEGDDDFDQDRDGWSVAGDDPDCDDGDPRVHPEAEDPPYDGLDTDCDEGNDFDWDRDGFVASDYGGEDCDDADPNAYPGAYDPPYDGVDSACDGDAYEYDVDGDGYPVDSDCDDADPGAYPGAPGEEWYDGVDTDCDGADDCDRDYDGYASGVGQFCNGDDCNDGDASVHPGAPDPTLPPDSDCDGDILEL